MRNFYYSILFFTSSIFAQDHKTAVTDVIKKFNGENQETTVGTFRLQTPKVEVFDLAGNELYKREVNEVEIFIREGFIRNIRITLDDNSIHENTTPIPLIKFDARFNNRIFNLPNLKNKAFTNYIKLGAVISYKRNDNITRAIENISIILKRKASDSELVILQADYLNKRNLTTEDNLNETQKKEFDSLKYSMNQVTLTDDDNLEKIIDYRVYSDFLGLINETSNGIVNFEAKVKIPLMHANIRNTNFYVFKNISPEVRYSRFDNKDRLIEIAENQNNQMVLKSKIDMLQKTYLTAGFRTEAVKWIPKNAFVEFTIPLFTYFNLAENRTTMDNPDGTTESGDLPKENLTSVIYGGGFQMTVNRSNNFKFDLGCNISQVKHLEKEENVLDKIGVFNMYNVYAEVSFVKKNTNEGVFLRFNYNEEFGSPQNFFQFQIGYKSSFNL